MNQSGKFQASWGKRDFVYLLTHSQNPLNIYTFFMPGYFPLFPSQMGSFQNSIVLNSSSSQRCCVSSHLISQELRRLCLCCVFTLATSLPPEPFSRFYVGSSSHETFTIMLLFSFPESPRALHNGTSSCLVSRQFLCPACLLSIFRGLLSCPHLGVWFHCVSLWYLVCC